jgi:hypothetical protein
MLIYFLAARYAALVCDGQTLAVHMIWSWAATLP